jgi:hypothetical protein
MVAGLTGYALNHQAPLITGLALTVEAEAVFLATGFGNFTVSITSPAPYIGGPYATDLSAEGGAAALNFAALATAPQAFFAPIVTRTTIAPGGSQNKVGDTYTAARGLWVYDSADEATVAQTGQWHLNGSPISGATGLTYTAAAAGSLTYVDTLTGAGATRTVVSNAISVAAVNQQVAPPLTAFTSTSRAPEVTGLWNITAGDGAATIAGFPAVPTSPAWSITAGDASATVTTYPG